MACAISAWVREAAGPGEILSLSLSLGRECGDGALLFNLLSKSEAMDPEGMRWFQRRSPRACDDAQ